MHTCTHTHTHKHTHTHTHLLFRLLQSLIPVRTLPGLHDDLKRSVFPVALKHTVGGEEEGLLLTGILACCHISSFTRNLSKEERKKQAECKTGRESIFTPPPPPSLKRHIRCKVSAVSSLYGVLLNLADAKDKWLAVYNKPARRIRTYRIFLSARLSISRYMIL